MFRYTIDSPTFLRQSVLELTDDPLQKWSDYPCLIWPRNLYRDGYGCVYKYVSGKKKTTRRAHREAWEIVNGPIPAGLMICHHCDTPACFRPIHLFMGGNSDNMRDCVAKGRYVNAAHAKPEMMKRGEEHGISKLKNSDVLEIRSLYPSISQARIGARFGVSQTLIGNIVRREIWKHI